MPGLIISYLTVKKLKRGQTILSDPDNNVKAFHFTGLFPGSYKAFALSSGMHILFGRCEIKPVPEALLSFLSELIFF